MRLLLAGARGAVGRRLHRARVVLLLLEEHLAAVEVGGRVPGIDGERLVDGLQRDVRVTADGHDESHVGEGVTFFASRLSTAW